MTRRSRTMSRIWPPVLAGILLVIVLSPYAWMVSGAFKSAAEILAVPPRLLPAHPTLSNFVDILDQPQMRRYFVNSLAIACVTIIVGLGLGSAAAFALMRRFPGRNAILLSTLITQLFPAVILIIPLYRLWSDIGFINTYQGLIVTYLGYNLPIVIWLLSGYLRTIPSAVIEAAEVDGARSMALYRLIVLPLSLPSLLGTAIVVLLGSWNEFIFALTFTTTDDFRTVTAGLYSFMGIYQYAWNLLITMSFLISLPVLVILVVFQRYMLTGVTSGATTG